MNAEQSFRMKSVAMKRMKEARSGALEPPLTIDELAGVTLSAIFGFYKLRELRGLSTRAVW